MYGEREREREREGETDRQTDRQRGEGGHQNRELNRTVCGICHYSHADKSLSQETSIPPKIISQKKKKKKKKQ